jgi:PTH1 family peptidyl-tRNA hydrolase
MVELQELTAWDSRRTVADAGLAPVSAFHPPGIGVFSSGMSFSMIIGLGNPGRQYDETRHNVGFMVLDRLAAAGGAVFGPSPKWQCQLAKLPGDGTLLVKPQTFMNLSGRAVQQLLAWHKWPPESMLVVYDDAALPLGRLRFREKGSAGGHNGIKSIIQHLGTDSFPRLKIGIGSSEPGEMTGHVLGKFSPGERALLENTLATATDAVQLAHSNGVAIAANRYHPHNPSNPPHTDEPQIPRPDHPQHKSP